MSDVFHDSKYSLERAKHHIRDFERQSTEFLNSDPYGFFVEIDPNTSQKVHKVNLTKPMPVALPGIASDAVCNLRSALDKAIYALSPNKAARYALFPFGRTASDFENTVKGRLKDLPEEIRNIVRGFKPYKGGNDALWALNEVCNADKHGFICPVAVASGGLTIHHAVFFLGSGKVKIPVWDRTKNEMELMRVSPETGHDVKLDLRFFIAIHDVEIVDGQPADAILDLFAREVESIIMAIEAESRRLGLVT